MKFACARVRFHRWMEGNGEGKKCSDARNDWCACACGTYPIARRWLAARNAPPAPAPAPEAAEEDEDEAEEEEDDEEEDAAEAAEAKEPTSWSSSIA